MDKKYAIFDMDGTLIDSMVVWQELGLEYLHAKGVEEVPDITGELAPLTMAESAAFLAERFGLEEAPALIAEELNRLMELHYENDIPLKNGVRELLAELKKAGVRMCVASATAERLVRLCLGRLGVLSCFDFVLSCESLGASKREPLIYLKAAELFGAAPGEIAVFEDAKYAVETARAAGFYVAAVYDGAAAAQWEQISRMAHEAIRFE